MTPTGSAPPQDGLGSSEAAGVLGLGFQSQFDVWNAKVHGITNTSDNAMMRWGRILEDVVAADFQERTGIKLVRILGEGGKQRTLRMKGHPLITARLDRRTFRRPRRIVEVKTSPYGSGYGDAGELADDRAGGPDGVPAAVRVQVYHQLAVTGYQDAIVAALIGGYQRRDYVIPRDDVIIADLVAELEDWWARYVETKTPPPVDGSAGAGAYLRGRYPRETADVLTATSEQAALVEEFSQARRASSAWAEIEIRTKQQLMEAIGDHAGLIFPGGHISFKAHDVTVRDWTLIAKAFRTVIEETAGSLTEAQIQDLPSTVQIALKDLDSLASIYTTTRTDRPFRVIREKE